MHDRCKKCGIYGLVEGHHPLPVRWWGGRKKDRRSNPWTVPLCLKCHSQADKVTLDIDADFGIVSECEARRFKDVFVDAFVLFMNQKKEIRNG